MSVIVVGLVRDGKNRGVFNSRGDKRAEICYNAAVKATAESLAKIGLRNVDALHVACAMHAACAYFITTDDQILARAAAITEIKITDPIAFIKKELQS